MSNDKRRWPRKQLNLPAWIDLGNDLRPQRCTLIDISDSGARLAVEDIEGLPDKFHLAMSRFGKSGRSCNVVWRSHDEVGIEFVASTQSDGCGCEGVDAAWSEHSSLEMFAGRLSRDDRNATTYRPTADFGCAMADDGVSARLLRKASALLAHGLRRALHPMET